MRCFGRAVAWVGLLVSVAQARAEERPILLRNSTDQLVEYGVIYADKPSSAPGRFQLGPGRQHLLRTDRPLIFSQPPGNRSQRFRLIPGEHYRLTRDESGAIRIFVSPDTARLRERRQQSPSTPWHDGPLRVIKVRAVAGRDYQIFYPNWHERTRQAVEMASRHFEEAFGIRFVVEAWQPWNYDQGQSPRSIDEAFEQLHWIDPDEQDLVIAFTLFTLPGPWANSEIRGSTQYFGQYVLIPDQWGTVGLTTRLVHELCHVFGAFHVATPGSVMQPHFENRTPRRFEVGAPGGLTVMAARDVDLSVGVTSLDGQAARRIRALHRRYRHPSEAEHDDPVVTSYKNEILRALQQRDSERAQQLLVALAELLGQTPDQVRPTIPGPVEG